ncbi:MAG: GNAT family N-acetyltransferase [Dehalococcoidia bacterium]
MSTDAAAKEPRAQSADGAPLPALTMRAATAEDVDGLVALVNAAYRKTEGHVFPGTTRTERGDLLEQVDRIIVAEADGRPVGCMYFAIEGERGHFGILAADVSMHGRGIGSALIAHAETLARAASCRTMHMEAVKEANLIPYYERRGYHVVRETLGSEWNDGADWGAAIAWHMVDMAKTL